MINALNDTSFTENPRNIIGELKHPAYINLRQLERDSKCLRPGFVRPKSNIDFSQLKFTKNRKIILKKTDIKMISS